MTSITKKTRNELLTEKPRSLFFRYLFPSLMTTMMVAVSFFVDTLCVGQVLGEKGIAALNISQPVTGVLYGLGYLLGVGGSTLYSAYIGKGDERKAKSVYSTCLFALLAFVFVLALLGTLFLDKITAFLGGSGDLGRGVWEYLLFVFLFAPFFSLETFMITFINNDSAPKIAMVAMLFGTSLNIILDVLFLFGFGWGIWAASLATSVSVLLSSFLLLGSTFRKKSGLKFSFNTLKSRELISASKLGLPSFLSEITTSVVILAFNSVLLRVSGETAVAVYGIIASITIIVISGIAGVSNAMQPLVSINAAAGKQERVKHFFRLAVLSSFCIVALFTFVGEIWPKILVNIFISPNQDFLSIAVPGIRIFFASYLFMATNVLIGVYFQSVQAPAEALTLTLLRGVIFPIMMVTGFAVFIGLDGVWLSTIAAEALALMVALGLSIRVSERLRDRNYANLRYFGSRRAPQNIGSILEELGANDMSSFIELVEDISFVDERTEGIPAYIGLEDLTKNYEGNYQPAYDDEDMGLLLATGVLLFTDLYEQNDKFIRDKKLEETYPAAALAMTALARKCFRFVYNEETEEFTIVTYLGHAKKEDG